MGYICRGFGDTLKPLMCISISQVVLSGLYKHLGQISDLDIFHESGASRYHFHFSGVSLCPDL